MFAFLAGRHPLLELSAQRIRLVPLQYRHFEEWAKLRQQSRAFLEPWEPVWAEDETSRPAFRDRCRRAKLDADSGIAHVYLIFSFETGRLLGGITLGNIRSGVSQSAQIGYWMGEKHAGKGYMQEAVTCLSNHAFANLKLHRLEAACIPGNERSVRVLQKCGFRQEGLLKSYLKINGKWEDHLLFARISGETETQ